MPRTKRRAERGGRENIEHTFAPGAAKGGQAMPKQADVDM